MPAWPLYRPLVGRARSLAGSGMARSAESEHRLALCRARGLPYEGLMMPLLMLMLVGYCLGPVVQAAEPSVKPVGAYPFLLPGLAGSPDVRPKVLLWCHGVKLVGVVAPESGHEDGSVGPQNRPSRTAFLVRDGRCEPDGSSLSFGFLVPLKAWIFESAGRGLEPRTTWLLNRFQGSVQGGQLKGVLVQVDVNHPGYSFHEHKIEAGALAESQASFADESGWHASMARAFSLAQSEP
jgi:hypothetical protein